MNQQVNVESLTSEERRQLFRKLIRYINRDEIIDALQFKMTLETSALYDRISSLDRALTSSLALIQEKRVEPELKKILNQNIILAFDQNNLNSYEQSFIENQNAKL